MFQHLKEFCCFFFQFLKKEKRVFAWLEASSFQPGRFKKSSLPFHCVCEKTKFPPEKRNGNDNEHRLEKIAKGAFLFFLFFLPSFHDN